MDSLVRLMQFGYVGGLTLVVALMVWPGSSAAQFPPRPPCCEVDRETMLRQLWLSRPIQVPMPEGPHRPDLPPVKRFNTNRTGDWTTPFGISRPSGGFAGVSGFGGNFGGMAGKGFGGFNGHNGL
jgi:hypothetical protein